MSQRLVTAESGYADRQSPRSSTILECVKRQKLAKRAAIGAAVLLAILWNIRVFSVYAIIAVPFEFAAVVFTMITITIGRSLCGSTTPTDGA